MDPTKLVAATSGGIETKQDSLRRLENLYEKGELNIDEYERLKNDILTEHNEENKESAETALQNEANKKAPVKNSAVAPITIVCILIVLLSFGYFITHNISVNTLSNQQSFTTTRTTIAHTTIQPTTIEPSTKITQTSFQDMYTRPTYYVGKQITVNGTLDWSPSGSYYQMADFQGYSINLMLPSGRNFYTGSNYSVTGVFSKIFFCVCSSTNNVFCAPGGPDSPKIPNTPPDSASNPSVCSFSYNCNPGQYMVSGWYNCTASSAFYYLNVTSATRVTQLAIEIPQTITTIATTLPSTSISIPTSTKISTSTIPTVPTGSCNVTFIFDNATVSCSGSAPPISGWEIQIGYGSPGCLVCSSGSQNFNETGSTLAYQVKIPNLNYNYEYDITLYAIGFTRNLANGPGAPPYIVGMGTIDWLPNLSTGEFEWKAQWGII